MLTFWIPGRPGFMELPQTHFPGISFSGGYQSFVKSMGYTVLWAIHQSNACGRNSGADWEEKTAKIFYQIVLINH